MKRIFLKSVLPLLLIATTVYAVESTKNINENALPIAKSFRGF